MCPEDGVPVGPPRRGGRGNQSQQRTRSVSEEGSPTSVQGRSGMLGCWPDICCSCALTSFALESAPPPPPGTLWIASGVVRALSLQRQSAEGFGVPPNVVSRMLNTVGEKKTPALEHLFPDASGTPPACSARSSSECLPDLAPDDILPGLPLRQVREKPAT